MTPPKKNESLVEQRPYGNHESKNDPKSSKTKEEIDREAGKKEMKKAE